MIPDTIPLPRRRILLVYFLLGAAAVTSQSVLLREFMVLAFGNELAWGFILFAWLASVSLGAALAGRLTFRRPRTILVVFIYLATALTLLALAGPVTARLARSLFNLTPGQYIPLLHMLWLSFLITLPTALLVGLCFPLACSLVENPASLYVCDSLGSLAGGVLFSFLLVSALPSLASVALLGSALLIALVTLWPLSSRLRLALPLALTSLVLATLILALSTGGLRALDDLLVHRRWTDLQGRDNLVASVDSPYQNIELARLSGQYSLYLDGMIATTFPDPVSFAETAHLVACQHPHPADVLILGGAAEGLLSQLLLHPLRHVDCVSLDPKVSALTRPYLAPVDAQALRDPRLTLRQDDVRAFLMHPPRQYDLILVLAPGPSSALANRTYTREFFRQAAAALKPEGVLSFGLASAASYFTDDRKRYLASVDSALRDSFPEVFMTWSTSSQVFACRRPGVLTTDPVELRRRYQSRNIRSDVFFPDWFDQAASDLLDPRKLDQIRRAALDAPATPANSDFFPSASFYHLVIWDDMTGSRSHAFFSILKSLQTHWPWLLLSPPLLAILWFAWLRFRLPRARSLPVAAVTFSAASTGFAAMSAELVLLFAFQSLYGCVYQRIGLIVALFMFGLAAGALLARRCTASRPVRPAHLAALDLVIALFLALTPFLLRLAARLAGPFPTLAEALVMTLVLLAGSLAGLAFPLCVALYRASGATLTRTAGAVVASDNLGACLGALLAGVALVPVVGMTVTCLLLAFLKLVSVGLLSLWNCAGKDASAS